MSKRVLHFFLILTSLVSFFNPSSIFAASVDKTCNSAGVGPTQEPKFIQPGITKKVKFTFTNLPKTSATGTPQKYRINTWWTGAVGAATAGHGYFSTDLTGESPDATDTLTLTITDTDVLNETGRYKALLQIAPDFKDSYCTFFFRVGADYTYDSCIIDAPASVSTDQDIIVNISNAPDKPLTFLDPLKTIQEKVFSGGWKWPIYFEDKNNKFIQIGSDGTASFVIDKIGHTVTADLYLAHPPDNGKIIEWIKSLALPSSDQIPFCKTTIKVEPPSPSKPTGATCSVNPTNPTTNNNVTITVVNIPKEADNKIVYPKLYLNGVNIPSGPGSHVDDKGRAILRMKENGTLDEGGYRVDVVNGIDKIICSKTFSVGIPKRPNLVEIITCKDITCPKAGGDPCGTDLLNPGFKTAIGCIHTSPVEFVKDFMKFIVAISGGIAFLMMLLGAYQMLASGGNPDSLNAGRERLTSAIIGLLFVIFAILFLQIIGVSILCIPGFGTCK